MEKKRFQELIHKWKREAERLDKKSAQTWEQLRNEELQQDDETIYSVYEDSAAATALVECATELEKILNAAR